MKKTELKQLIKEVIQQLNEGADWIALKSINYVIDSNDKTLIPFDKQGNVDLTSTIEPDSIKYNELIKRLSPKDKEIVNSLNEKEPDEGSIKPQVPESLVKKLQNLLNTTNKIFDFAVVFTSTTYSGGEFSGFDFEFFSSIDDIDYDSLEGTPICRVYKDKVELIKGKK